MNSFHKLTQLTMVALVVLACVFAAHAQVTTGTVRGTVTDPNGAVVPNAKVTITKQSTTESKTTQTTSTGEYAFNNLLPGNDYSIAIEAPNFKTLTLSDVRIQLNQTTDVPAQLTLGSVGETAATFLGGPNLPGQLYFLTRDRWEQRNTPAWRRYRLSSGSLQSSG